MCPVGYYSICLLLGCNVNGFASSDDDNLTGSMKSLDSQSDETEPGKLILLDFFF